MLITKNAVRVYTMYIIT